MCKVKREMPTPSPSSLARPLLGSRDLRISCPSSQCQNLFHPPEGSIHFPVYTCKPKEGCLQRLRAEFRCAGWGIHTCMHNTSHGVGWPGVERKGRQARASSPNTTMAQQRSLGVRILNSNLAFQVIFQGRIEYILFNSLIPRFVTFRCLESNLDMWYMDFDL